MEGRIIVVLAAFDEKLHATVFVNHSVKDVAVAVGIVTYTDEDAPPVAADVELKVDDATISEVEVKVVVSLMRCCPANAGASVRIEHGY